MCSPSLQRRHSSIGYVSSSSPSAAAAATTTTAAITTATGMRDEHSLSGRR